MHPMLTIPGSMRAFVLVWTGPLSFSQLKVGGGKPVASHDRETKLFTTTFTLSAFKPMMMGGTKRKKKKSRRQLFRFSFERYNEHYIANIYMTLTMNVKVKRFFCTSSHIVSHAHIPSCVRYLSRQNLTVGEGKGGFSIVNMWFISNLAINICKH